MSDMTIDQLKIEVEASSQTAASGIDALSASLEKLKSATKGGLGLTSVTNQLSKLNTALSAVSRANAGKLSDFGYALQKLQGASNIKLSSSIAPQIQNIGNAVQSLNGVDFGKVSELVTALQPLSTIGKSNLNSFISQLTRLPQALQGLKNIDIKSLTTQIQQLSDAMRPLADNMGKIAAGFAAFPNRIQRLIKTTNNLSKSNEKASKSYVNLAAKLAIAINMVRAAGRVIASMINQANKYIEDMNLFTVSMGKYAEEASKYAEKVSEVLGLDPAEFMRNEGIFNTIIKGFGVVEDRAYKMSRNLTQLGYDISSFYNISFEDAMTKLQSGISGELEPLRRLGYDLSVARLQQEAYTLGIEKKVSAMTQAEKAELRYYAIMTQVTDAQGDMARTIDAPANQLRILQAQITQCARAWGNLFIPILNAVLPYLIAVAKVLRMIAEIIAGFFGIKIPTVEFNKGLGGAAGSAGDVADSLGDAEDSLGNAAKKAKEVKNALLGIDELNIISPPDEDDGSGSGKKKKDNGLGDIGGGGFDFPLPEYDFLGDVQDKIQGIIDKLLDWLGLNKKIENWADFMKTRLYDILTIVAGIAAGIASWKLLKFLKDLGLLKLGLGQITGLALAIGGAVAYILEYWNAWVNGMDLENTIILLGSMAAIIGGLYLAFGGLGAAIGAVVTGVGLLVLAIRDAFKDKVNEFNFGGMIVGAITTSLGAAVAGAKIAPILIKLFDPALFVEIGAKGAAALGAGIAGGAAAAVTGIALYFVGIWDAIKNRLNWLNGMLIGGGATLAGAGIGAMIGALGGPIGAGIGALIGLAVGLITDGIIAIVQNWDAIKEWWSGVWSRISGWWTGTVVPFFQGIPAWFGQKIDAIKQFFVEKWTAIVTFMQSIPDKIKAVIAAIGKWFSELPGKIGYALGYALGAIVKWVVDTANYLKVKIPETIENIRKWFAELPAKIQNAIASAVTKVMTWGQNMWNAFKTKVQQIITSVQQWFAGLPEKIYNAIKNAINKVATWANDMIAKVKEVVPKIITAIVDFFKELPQKLYDLGTDIINGLLNGIKNAWESLKSGVKDFCGGFVQGFKDALGIASPSKEFATVGEFSADGLIVGVQDKFNAVKTTMTDFAGKVLSWFEGSGESGIVGKFKTTASDVVKGFKDKVSDTYTTVRSAISTWTSDIKNYFTNSSLGAINVTEFAKYAQNTISGFKDKITNTYTTVRTSIQTWASDIKDRFINPSLGAINNTTFGQYASNVISGFKDKVSSTYTTVRSAISTWASDIKERFTGNSYGAVNATKFSDFAKNVVDGFKNKVSSYYSTAQSTMQSFGNAVRGWFEKPDGQNTLVSQFTDIGKNVIQGFIDGVSALWDKAMQKIKDFGKSIIDKGKEGTEESSPSRAFKKIGAFVVEGFNIGVEDMIPASVKTMDKWLGSINNFDAPTMDFAVDTSSLKYYNTDDFTKAVSADVQSHSSFTATGFKEGMQEFYEQYLQPTMTQIAEDTRRQADKAEVTNVQIGNRAVRDAVVTQQRADGYSFVRA
jgi:methyl-accepting chemotaxis protein